MWSAGVGSARLGDDARSAIVVVPPALGCVDGRRGVLPMFFVDRSDDDVRVTTASDFHAAATCLSAVRDELRIVLGPVSAAASDLRLDGPLRVVVEAAVAVSHANVMAGTTALQMQIAEAHRRAAMCDDFSRAVRMFLRGDDPTFRSPSRPAWWVDDG